MRRRWLAAYLAGPALELWLVEEDGTLETNEQGPVAASSLRIVLGPLPR